MESKNNKNRNVKKRKSKVNLKCIKSSYIFKNIYDILNKKESLEIVKYNKNMQKRLNLNIKDYKKYSETMTPIEIEIITNNKKFDKFIDINEKEKLYYHIYFNDNKVERKNKYLINKKDKIGKIKIIIDYQVKSFEKLF